MGLGELHQGERPAHRSAVLDEVREVGQPGRRRVPRRGRELHRVALDLLVHEHLAYRLAGAEDLGPAQHRSGPRHAPRAGHAVDDPNLFVPARIPDAKLHHEAVELGLGERVGALLLDRVLGRHDEERLLEPEGLLAEGHLALLHGFEQR